MQQLLNEEYQRPRIAPIEKPSSLKLKLAYWFTEKIMGKVLTTVKVIFSRFPEALGLSRKMQTTAQKITLNDDLVYLLKCYISTLNGCAFCLDLEKSRVTASSELQGKYDHLMMYAESERFTDAEKTALRYVEEATLHKNVQDVTFKSLRTHFNERQIVEMT
jgi:alkylhydroperoxidase family enzyme